MNPTLLLINREYTLGFKQIPNSNYPIQRPNCNKFKVRDFHYIEYSVFNFGLDFILQRLIHNISYIDTVLLVTCYSEIVDLQVPDFLLVLISVKRNLEMLFIGKVILRVSED